MDFKTFLFTYWVCTDTLYHVLSGRSLWINSPTDPHCDLMTSQMTEHEKFLYGQDSHPVDIMNNIHRALRVNWEKTVPHE
jgi:hypothetical protein